MAILNGTQNNDTIAGTPETDIIRGFNGQDRLSGEGGDDLVYGGDGDDKIFGDAGSDRRVIEGNDSLFGGSGQDSIGGQGGNDLIDGGDGDDRLSGDAGNDNITGGQGQDRLEGGIGDDTLSGGTGDDRLLGGDGKDTLIASPDNDNLSGGFGSDLFKIDAAGNHVIVGGEDPDGSDVDVLDLTGQKVNVIFSANDPEAGRVEFLDENGNVTRRMNFTEIEKVIVCFTPGTAIVTPRGECAVEDLRVGDRVVTRDNGIQEIRWIGRKEISGKTLMTSSHLRPIMINAGALGHGLPERDMLVSPNHRVLIAGDRTQLYFEEPEVLVAAKYLVDAPGIRVQDVVATSYLHFMFDRHEVVLSNGAWTESFQPGDYSLNGIGNAQRAEILDLFPELTGADGFDTYPAARKSLKRHEALLLVK